MRTDVAAVLADVVARRPLDGREARSRDRVIVAMQRLRRPFDQDDDTTHVTASALVMGRQGVLLHLHKRFGIWLQPGGHLEPGEWPWEAAKREAEEETGLLVRWPEEGRPPLAHIDVHDGGRGHTHLDLRYILSVEGDETPAPPLGESQDVRWFGWDDAQAVADPGLKGFLVAYAPRP